MRVHNKQKRFFQTFADGAGPDQSAHLHNKEKGVSEMCMYALHYENMPIQIYWKFYHLKMKIFKEKIVIFFKFLLKT